MSYHGQRTLMESVLLVNEKTSHIEPVPLVDTTGLCMKPLCFIMRGGFEYVYYVNDFSAAARAVRQINEPEYYSLSDKHAILTASRLVSSYTARISDATRETLQHSVGVTGCLVDIPRLITCGVLTPDNVHRFESLGSAVDGKAHYFMKPVEAVVAVWRRARTGKKFRVNMSATSAVGFIGFHVDESTTPPHIARTICAYYTKIAMRIARHVMRLTM
jgi:hypothetical protein